MQCVHEVHAMNILQVSYVGMLTYLQKKRTNWQKTWYWDLYQELVGSFL